MKASPTIPPGFEPVDHPDVRRLTARIHVHTPVMEVIKTLARKMRRFKKLPRATRRYAIAAAIQHHARNLHEYNYVMGSVPRKFPKFQPRYYFNRATKETIIVAK